MKTYQLNKILVPIDFSTISLNALRHAEKVASLTRARITLLHVVQPYVGLVGGPGVEVQAVKLEKEIAEEHTKGLEKIASFSSARSKVPVEFLVKIGNIGSIITQVARKIGADLIIMGTHGASGFVEGLLGSTTYHVATLASIPVMSVHRQTGRSGYSHIVYPVREKTRAMEKFPYALAFAKMGNARVDVVGLLGSVKAERRKRMRAACTSISREFKRFGILARTEYTLNEQFADATIEYANPHSLVVIFQDDDFRLVDIFRRSFTKRVLHKTLSPVLTIPSPK